MSWLRCSIALYGLWLLAGSAIADAPRVLDEGELPKDSRLSPLKDLNGYFPFQPSDSIEAWERRAKQRRIATQVALGLWPMPTRVTPNAVVHGRTKMDGYTIEKVYLQSFPGFYVTGNLYRPVSREGKRTGQSKHPGVLCPHGHFQDGRFGAMGVDAVRGQIVQGAERFEDGGRNQIQSRCVQLARMGCVVFQYDMVGYCDSTQISYQLAHRFAEQRPDMTGANRWGLFSPQAESHLQSVMGLQTYNSIRALDWLCELPDVDPDRIAVTGASGGGTQTFLLCAIDPRPRVSVPAVMVSTAMQGGCTCENASLLRVGTGNVEFAALFAPRPQCLISANDWTREMPAKGFPELQAHYELLGAKDRLRHVPLLHFGHNYNYVSRAAMYQWLNRHLDLGLDEPVVEEDYKRLTADELSVWDDTHPRPESGPQFERRLLRWWAEDATAQLAKAEPHDSRSLADYRKVVGAAVGAMLGELPSPEDLELDEKSKTDSGTHLQITGMLKNRRLGESLPIMFLVPNGWQNGDVAIWLDPTGKAGLFDGDSLSEPAQALLQKNVAVIGVDLFFQGEFLQDGSAPTETRRVANTRQAACYTLGYNRSLFAQRVHDVVSVIQYVSHHERSPAEVWLVGLNSMGPIAAAARAQTGSVVHRAVVDTQGFRFADVNNIRDPNLLPGGAKYHDLPGMLALSAPNELLVAGEDEVGVSIATHSYAAAGARKKLQLLPVNAKNINRDALEWLLRGL